MSRNNKSAGDSRTIINISVLPKSLMMKIEIMVDNNIDSFEACEKAAILLDENSKMFKELVDAAAERRYKSRFMTQLDKARASIKEEAYKEGYDDGYNKGYNESMKIKRFTVPCSICGKPMVFTSNNEEWFDKVRPMLYEVFKDWYHTKCKS